MPLDVISSLAAHGEANGSSSAKLRMMIWLVAASRSKSRAGWANFYEQWEKVGRVWEHLLLARIRYVRYDLLFSVFPSHRFSRAIFADMYYHCREAASTPKMPRRLTELIEHYPYAKYASRNPSGDIGLLPRTRFSTRRYDALFFRLETQFSGITKPKTYFPIQIIQEVSRSTYESTAGDHAGVWEVIQKWARSEQEGAAAEVKEEDPVLNRIFEDGTIRLLSMVRDKELGKEKERGRSLIFSFAGDFNCNVASPATATTDSNAQTPTAAFAGGTAPTTPSPRTPTDTEWTQFSSRGFKETPVIPKDVASTLWDQDIEQAKPPSPVAPLSRKSFKKRDESHTRCSSTEKHHPQLQQPDDHSICARSSLSRDRRIESSIKGRASRTHQI